MKQAEGLIGSGGKPDIPRSHHDPALHDSDAAAQQKIVQLV